LNRRNAIVVKPDIICGLPHFGDPRSLSCFFFLLLSPLKRHVNANANEPYAEKRQPDERLPVDRNPSAN
jgi:hypothetical protein